MIVPSKLEMAKEFKVVRLVKDVENFMDTIESNNEDYSLYFALVGNDGEIMQRMIIKNKYDKVFISLMADIISELNNDHIFDHIDDETDDEKSGKNNNRKED